MKKVDDRILNGIERYLIKKDYEIISRYNCDEINLVCKDNNDLVFIIVKVIKSISDIPEEDTVDSKYRKTLEESMFNYIVDTDFDNVSLRVDIMHVCQVRNNALFVRHHINIL